MNETISQRDAICIFKQIWKGYNSIMENEKLTLKILHYKSQGSTEECLPSHMLKDES
jgi:hypothetical protein